MYELETSKRDAPVSPARPDGRSVVRRSSGRGSPLPDSLRLGVEHLSGIPMSDVRVHRDNTPFALGAAAYTEGSRIRLGPGGERHLAHEAWHVVQQRQGRVRLEGSAAGVGVNTDARLEREADQMGERASRIRRSTLPWVDRSITPDEEPVVQRYTLPKGAVPDDPHNEPRLSASGKMLRMGAHRLYVDPALVPPANAKLAATGGGKGSFVRLTLIDEHEGSLQRVVPIVRQRTTQLLRSQGPRKPFLEQNDRATYQSPADCHVAAQTVMGSDDSAIGSFNSEKLRMALPGAASANVDVGDEAGAHIANRAKHTFYAKAMPEFAVQLETHALAALPAFQKVIAAIRAVDPDTVEFGRNNAWAAVYRQEILPVPAIAKLFAATFKINEFAEPEVGRAFTNVNDETQKHAGEQAGQDVWNFHWAGIVLVDGPDYVTLENLSTENINELNEAWFFHLYGANKQSFHTQSLADPHATPAALTLGIDTTAEANHPARNLRPSLNQKMVLYWFNDPANRDAQFADFAGCRVKFGTPMDALFGICDKLFGYNKVDVENPANFANIRRDICQAIVDRGLETQAPPVIAAPVVVPGPH